MMEEPHRSTFAIHPGATKMYLDLKRDYWWLSMKRGVAWVAERCLTCRWVKAEHQHPHGPLQPLEIPQWKWEQISIDFITKLPRTVYGVDAIWVIVDPLTKSARGCKMKIFKLTRQEKQVLEVILNKIWQEN